MCKNDELSRQAQDRLRTTERKFRFETRTHMQEDAGVAYSLDGVNWEAGADNPVIFRTFPMFVPSLSL